MEPSNTPRATPLRLSPPASWAYPEGVDKRDVSGGAGSAGRRGQVRERVASTSCLVVVFVVLILVLVVAPAVLWSAGIACG